ncbi:MAG: hypothetical protein R2774_12360 [Saprospiraceae bacterium]
MRIDCVFSVIASLLFVLGCNCIEKLSNATTESNICKLISSSQSPIDVIEDGRTLLFFATASSSLSGVNYHINNNFQNQIKQLNLGLSMAIFDNIDANTSKIQIDIKNNDICNAQSVYAVNYYNIKSKIIYCDPKKGSLGGSGTRNEPFPALSTLLQSGYHPSPNEVIFLLDGNHGDVFLSGEDFSVCSASNASPILNSIQFINANNIALRSVEILSNKVNSDAIVWIDSLSSKIQISNCFIGSDVDIHELESLTWKKNVYTGIYCNGTACTFRYNLIQDVFHGFQSNGDSTIFDCNIIDRFCGDAIRNTGDNSTYSNNFITNALIDDYYDPLGNHDDMFQAWTHDLPIKNITISDNIAISYTDTTITNLAKIVQGLVCFDGFAENWRIENNIVLTDHPHGIALYGAKDCFINNNIVMRHPGRKHSFESDPWIMIHDHKDGRESKNTTLFQNKASNFRFESKDIISTNNTLLDSLMQDKMYEYYGWK